MSGARLGLLLLGAVGLASFAASVAARLGFPFPLEWMEGASLDHALRLLQGQPLYAAPSAEFIPYLYPPLAYAPIALAVAAFGPALPVARGAALACSALALLAIGRAAARGAESAAVGVAAAGLFAIGYGYGGAFLDLVRVDACFVLLIALAAERLLAQRPRAALAWLVLSAFAKQHGLVLLAAVSAVLLVRERRKMVPAIAAAWLATGSAFAAFELTSAGWFGRYTFALPAGQPLEPALLLSFFGVDLLLYLPVLSLACALALWPRLRADALTPFDALLLAGVLVSALGRAHAGGHDNVRLPAFALLCIAGCIELGRRLEHPDPTSNRWRRAWPLAALALQFALLWQAPAVHAPAPADAERFIALRAALLRAARGEPAIALDYARLTPTPFLHTMALSDLRSGRDSALARAGTRALLERLRGARAPGALAVGERFPALARVLDERYRLCAELPAPRLATGYRPGLLRAGRRWQQVHVRADLYDAARCAAPSAAGTTGR